MASVTPVTPKPISHISGQTGSYVVEEGVYSKLTCSTGTVESVNNVCRRKTDPLEPPFLVRASDLTLKSYSPVPDKSVKSVHSRMIAHPKRG